MIVGKFPAPSAADRKDRARRFPGQVDGLCKHEHLVAGIVHQGPLDSTHRQFREQRQGGGRLVELSQLRKSTKPLLSQLAILMELLYVRSCSGEIGRVVAQACLKLIGGLPDHLPDKIRPCPVRRFKLEPHGLRGRLKQVQKILARDFRPRPDQERKLAVMPGTRHQFGVAEIGKPRAGICRRAYHDFLVAAFNENVGDAFAELAAL